MTPAAASPARRSHLQSWLACGACALLPSTVWATGKMHKNELQAQSWKAFEAQFIQKDGRVISDDGARSQTYSEGQAYALFFALVANDRPAFARILAWTQNNLCQGDLSQHLPAWLWGLQDKQQWGVIDANAASDADVWIAYTLLQAGRRWNERSYTALGKALGQLILTKECTEVPGLGLTLLPGPVGFAQEGKFKLNASYSPLQLFQALAQVDARWNAIAESSWKVIAGSSPRGICADWVWFDGKEFSQDVAGEAQGRGGYNAIRTYLWAGMLHTSSQFYQPQLKLLAPMAELVQSRGIPPEYIDPWTLEVQGDGPAGFSAAMLPFLQAQKRPQGLQQQLHRLQTQPVRPTAYYEQCLNYFSDAWRRGNLAFDAQGHLRWGADS
jgi:endoglucanase